MQMQPVYGQPQPPSPPSGQTMERYAMLDQGFTAEMIVKQDKKGLCGCFKPIKFDIIDPSRNNGNFHAVDEEVECWKIFCCANNRDSVATMYDGPNKESANPMLIFKKNLTFHSGNCCFCAPPKMTVEAAEGKYLGKAEIPFWCCNPKVVMYDQNDVEEAVADFDMCGSCNCCGSIIFSLAYTGKEKEGEIEKVWGGLAKEMFTEADTFRVKYAENQHNADQKARLLAATMLLNMMFFERQNDNN